MKIFTLLLLIVVLNAKVVLSQWAPMSTSTNAPTPRGQHGAIWTGTRMIIWGGYDGAASGLGDGKIFNPATNVWSNMSSFNAPSPRRQFSIAWTGSKLIVWGGVSNGNYLNTGGVYDPLTDTWTPMSTANAPTGRKMASAVWAGSNLIVWGGNNDVISYNTGAMFNPEFNSWTPMSITSAPSARSSHSAVWTGQYMIVWGGNTNATNNFNTGGIFDPNSNSWIGPTSINGITPSARTSHTTIWTGSRMIVWGGINNTTIFGNGAIYNPTNNTWESEISNGPSARTNHCAVWSGRHMFIWGGYDGINQLNSGSRYDPINNTWTELSALNVPSPRSYHTCIWALSKLIVWGGSDVSGVNWTNTGGMYESLAGIQQNHNKVPDRYLLSQNYPNPFNPVTNIKFEIPKSEFVNIKVFDIVGKEVKELVNQNLSPGEYKVDFNGSEIESGIYFYRINAGEFAETRKMMLVK